MRGCPRATEQILVDETGAEPRGSGVHGALFGCSSGEPSSVAMAATGEGGAQGGSAAMVPKYVFLFIGDGMSYPQIQASAYFNGAQL